MVKDMLRILLIFLLCWQVSQTAFSQDDPTDPSGGGDTTDSNTTVPDENTPISWSAEILDQLLDDLGDELDSQMPNLSSSIFEALTDVELYSFGDDYYDVGFKIQRKVFDNRDIMNSYTVVDFFRVPISLPIPILSDTISANVGNVGLHLGANLSISTMNIRQVKPKDLESLPSLSILRNQKDNILSLKETETTDEQVEDEANHPDPNLFANIGEGNDSGDDQSDDDTDDNTQDEDRNVLQNIRSFLKWDTENALNRARYSSILNLLTHPFKTPLTNRALRKMDVGEISSYSLDGSIQLGGTVGFSGLEVMGLENLTAGVSLTTYLHGKFKVSVLKEKDNQVQLKVSKNRTLGVATSIGMGASDHEIFGGVMILGFEDVGRIKESVIPFNLSINRPTSKSFDVGYRYDLDNPRAKKAYFKAAFGMLKASEELAKKNDGVTKLYTREQITNSRNRNYRMKLSLVYQRGHVTSASTARAVITINGKEHHLFNSINRNTRGHSAVWDDSESRSYKFHTTIDGEVFASDPDKGMALKVEATIDDQFTTADEMKSYIREVVAMTGIDDILMPFPQHDPEVDCDDYRLVYWSRSSRRNNPRGRVNNRCYKERDKAYYGRSKFFYRLSFNRKQLEKFARYDEDKMWEILEIAFGVKAGVWASQGSRTARTFLNGYATLLNAPLTLLDVNIASGSRLHAARSFYKRWKQLRTIDDLEKLSKTITKLFNTTYFSYEFLKVIKLTLEGEEVGYYVNATADRLFGNIAKSGKIIEEVDTITGRASRIIDFDRADSRINHNVHAVIQNLEINQTKDKNEIVIEFDLPRVPKYLYFRADRTNNWKAYKRLGKYILINDNGTFVKGHNKIVIKEGGTDRLSKELSKKVFESKYVTFMMAISFGEDGWGSVFSKRIKIKQKLEDKIRERRARKEEKKIIKQEKKEAKKEAKQERRWERMFGPQ